MLARMNILMLSDVHFPRVNGVSTSIRTAARWLHERGHEVTLVAPHYGQEVDEPFEVLRVPAWTLFFDPEDRLMRPGALRGVERALAQRSWDVIHIHTPFQAHRLGLRLARATGAPTVESYHTYFEQYVAHYLPFLPAGLLRAASRGLSRRLCNAVDHLVVPSEQISGVLDGYGVAVPRTVLPTGIDLRTFAGGDGAAFRARHGIAADRPVIATVSRLAREKNIDFLLEVAARVRASVPDLLFIVAGEGPDGARLRERAARADLSDCVRFFGYLDRETELLDCYRAADLFVFASPTETQGLVLIEALALGLPVVSTAVMGTASVLRGAGGARIVPESVPEFAAQVSALLQSPAERQRLSLLARDDAGAWAVPALMARMERLYQSLGPAEAIAATN